MVVDAAIVGAGDSAQFDAAPSSSIIRFERLHLLGAIRCQAILQIDRGQRRGQLPQIGGGRADLGRQLAEAPMGRGHACLGAGQDQG